eukprot:5756174-Pleurochrysis_carterae.AAC.1
MHDCRDTDHGFRHFPSQGIHRKPSTNLASMASPNSDTQRALKAFGLCVLRSVAVRNGARDLSHCC